MTAEHSVQQRNDIPTLSFAARLLIARTLNEALAYVPNLLSAHKAILSQTATYGKLSQLALPFISGI